MTQKKQPRDSILGRVAQTKALCTQKSQHLLSKGHQTHHSGKWLQKASIAKY